MLKDFSLAVALIGAILAGIAISDLFDIPHVFHRPKLQNDTVMRAFKEEIRGDIVKRINEVGTMIRHDSAVVYALEPRIANDTSREVIITHETEWATLQTEVEDLSRLLYAINDWPGKRAHLVIEERGDIVNLRLDSAQ